MKGRKRIAALVVAGIAAPVSLGAADLPRPEAGLPRTYVAPPAVEDSLENGFLRSFVPFRATPLAHVELVVRTGTADDPEGKTGLAEWVGEYLREGSTERDATAIARSLSELGVVGGDVAISVRAFETILSADVLAESTPRLVELLGELAEHPAFAPEQSARLQANLVRRIPQRSGTPTAASAMRVNSLLFPRHPADRVPTETGIRALTIDAARAFHADHYVARRAHLYVAGSFDLAAVRDTSRRLFEGWPAGRAAPSIPPSSLVQSSAAQGAPPIHLIDRPGTTQARIQVSAPVVDPSHPDHAILNQLNVLLGAVQRSRIIANVREEHGYSYNVSSRLARRPGASQWMLTADVANDVVAEALREIEKELVRVVDEPPPAEELQRFQAFLSGSLVAENSTPAGIVDTMRFFDLYGMKAAARAQFMSRIHTITPADVQRVAQTYLRSSQLVVVVAGDRKTLEAPLAAIGRVVD